MNFESGIHNLGRDFIQFRIYFFKVLHKCLNKPFIEKILSHRQDAKDHEKKHPTKNILILIDFAFLGELSVLAVKPSLFLGFVIGS